MSRSIRKTKKIGNLGSKNRSEKYDKRKANRLFRRISKEKIQKVDEPPNSIKEVSDVWSFAKDGKFYWQNMPKRYLRK